MIVVGILVGSAAVLIWIDNRPLGAKGDYLAGVISTVVSGLIDWLATSALGLVMSGGILGWCLNPFWLLYCALDDPESKILILADR